MRKIPTLFIRDPEDRRYVLPEVTPGCEWVLVGEGVATRKYDGTCVMLDADGRWWARREVKPGKTPPEGWQPVGHDDVTGKSVGWEPIEQSAFYKFFIEADEYLEDAPRPGTYELIGPKINGNPEHVDHHLLIRHADADVLGEFKISGDGGVQSRDFVTIRGTLQVYAKQGFEGIVWHHPDGRMAKLKVRDIPPEPGR